MRIEDSLARYSSVLKTDSAANKNSLQTTDLRANFSGRSFESVLNEALKTNELTFSKHAEQRLLQRDIELEPDEIQKLNSAVLKAGEKGVKNTLVVTDKAAFIINVTNNTVITAMDKNDLKDNIFTQIDGAVII